MRWAAIARVLEILRWPVSAAAAFAGAVALTKGPFREIPPVLPVVFVVAFVIVLLVAVFVMTALLAFAEQAADEAERKQKRTIDLPTAIATYRPAEPPEPPPTDRAADSAEPPPSRPAP